MKALGAKCCDKQWRAHHPDGFAVSATRLHGRASRVRADRIGAAGDHVHASQRSFDDCADIQWHGRRGLVGRAIFPARRRFDDVRQRYGSHDQVVADDGRASAGRACAGGDPVQHVFCRNFRFFRGGRRRAQPHSCAGNGSRRLRPGVYCRANRIGRHHGEPHPAQHHGGGLRRDRQCLDRWAISRRRRAWRSGRHGPDDLQPFLRTDRRKAQACHVRRVLARRPRKPPCR